MKYNRLSVFLLAIMLLATPVSAIAELSAHEYKLFSCLYLAGKADKTMTLTDIAAIANHEPIDFVDYSLGASGYLEPMLHIYLRSTSYCLLFVRQITTIRYLIIGISRSVMPNCLLRTAIGMLSRSFPCA